MLYYIYTYSCVCMIFTNRHFRSSHGNQFRTFIFQFPIRRISDWFIAKKRSILKISSFVAFGVWWASLFGIINRMQSNYQSTSHTEDLEDIHQDMHQIFLKELFPNKPNQGRQEIWYYFLRKEDHLVIDLIRIWSTSL